MHWYEPFRSEIEQVFQEAEDIIESFPAPLNAAGLRYIEKFNPSNDQSTNNYICYCLPYWMQDMTGLSTTHCRRLALAGIFVMLYYFIQDDVMDNDCDNPTEQLALGNLCYIELLDIYRQLFPPQSPFWDSYRQYTLEWVHGVTSEREQDVFMTDRLKIAHKAAPVKLASSGALYLTDMEGKLQQVTETVDTVLICLQMNDDWADWQTDLQDGSYNCLLAWIRSIKQIQTNEPLTEQFVRHAITVSDVLHSFGEEALQLQTKLDAMPEAAPHLIEFSRSLVESLFEESDRIRQHREALMMGGLSYWLSNSVTK
ncbi:hypothetical protein PAALTS15_22003 [Paenibacillus alvei TS-15]|uniref:Terpene synthase n=1 Tax=Paenibacillus alvei TS-15 TaxID=1117108 RepID=S9SM18_PAEAL|nr:hypothetical protein [Paenibacillus alvei]EPY05093.1 hypothetical protein PAALTS15_22003 [Paenibacillus alvei TS-15]